MIKGTIESIGFEYTISDDALDDWELIEVLNEIDGGEQHKIPTAFRLLLGDDQTKKIKDAVRSVYGHVSTAEMVKIFSQIMTDSNTKK